MGLWEIDLPIEVGEPADPSVVPAVVDCGNLLFGGLRPLVADLSIGLAAIGPGIGQGHAAAYSVEAIGR